MGASSASPLSTHKRPKWNQVYKEATKTLLIITELIKQLEFSLTQHYSKYAQFKVINLASDITKVCNRCKYEEFKEILIPNIVKPVNNFASNYKNNKIPKELWFYIEEGLKIVRGFRYGI